MTFEFSPVRVGEFTLTVTVSDSPDRSALGPALAEPGPTIVGTFSIAEFLHRQRYSWDLADVQGKAIRLIASVAGVPTAAVEDYDVNTWKPSSYDLPFDQIAEEAICDVNDKLRTSVFPLLEIVTR